MMKISYINAEMSKNFEESISLGVEAGADAVDLRANIWGNNIEKISDDEATRVKEMLSEYGLHTGMLLPPVGKCNIEDLGDIQKHTDMFRRVAELAHNLVLQRDFA